jgi:hypothetical protein
VLAGLPNYPKGHVEKEYRFFKNRQQIIDGVNIVRCFEIGRRKSIVFLALNYLSFYDFCDIESFYDERKI